MRTSSLPGRAELDRRLASVMEKPGADLSGLAAVGVQGADVAYEGYFGYRTFAENGRTGVLPVDRETRFRAASISKPVTAIGLMRLVEKGLFDLDADLSGYLGFQLRNPHYPKTAITARMLLSHTSSIRDEDFYFPPLPHRIEELFHPGGRYYENGLHFAGIVEGTDNAPGRRYCYCNLGYGLLGTCIERVTGRRFDLYMRDEVLTPLGIDGSYNVNLISDAGFRCIAPLYRRAPGEGGPWDPDGPWIAQVDDYHGIRPALPVRVDPAGSSSALGSSRPRLEDYVIGTNGALFAPQGGLRISALDLSKILRVLMNGGGHAGTRLLEARTVAAMMSGQWTYDRAKDNGEASGFTRETGLGLMHTTDSRHSQGSDFVAETGGVNLLNLWGHHGEAYGLLGAMLFEPDEKWGFIYLIGGTSVPPAENKPVEEEIQAALVAALRPSR